MIASVGLLLCVSLALGISFSLLLVRPQILGPKFFRLHATIAAALVGVAAILLGQGDIPSLSGMGGKLFILSAAFLLYAATVLWLPPLIERLWLWGSGLVGLFWLGKMVTALDQARLWGAGDIISIFSGGCVVALSLVAMNIGHSYLSAVKLSIAPFRRVTQALGILLIWRGLWLMLSVPIMIVMFPEGVRSLEGLFAMENVFQLSVVTVRILFGIVGPFVLTILAWETVKIESTQSATGILYAVVAMLLVGETSAIFLTLSTVLSL